MDQVQLSFTNEFSGTLKTSYSELTIGSGEGTFQPYPLLMGALGACLYATFIGVVKKMKLDFTSCDLNIEWEKRTEVPTTCKIAIVHAKIYGAEEEKKDRYTHAFKLATEYCSIYNTVAKVAEMRYEVDFN